MFLSILIDVVCLHCNVILHLWYTENRIGPARKADDILLTYLDVNNVTALKFYEKHVTDYKIFIVGCNKAVKSETVVIMISSV